MIGEWGYGVGVRSGSSGRSGVAYPAKLASRVDSAWFHECEWPLALCCPDERWCWREVSEARETGTPGPLPFGSSNEPDRLTGVACEEGVRSLLADCGGMETLQVGNANDSS